MTEKIKVSQGIANTIDRYITRNIKNYELSLESAMEDLIVCHPNIDWEDYLDGEFRELEKITTYDLMRVLILGYEVELTAEEELLKEYKKHCDFCHGEPHSLSGKFAAGIEFTLSKLGIKIDGINK